MAGYLEEYGESDARRSRVIRWIVISASVVGVAALAAYLLFPIAAGWWHVRGFLGDLKKKDFQAAYRDWGCTKPCSDYTFASFMEDWGPKSRNANASALSVRKARPCGGGTIVMVAGPDRESQQLWYRPSDASLTFWPWEGCPPRFRAPDQAPTP